MDNRSRRVLEEALQLPPIERAKLVEDILSSFDQVGREELDRLWVEEVEDRIEAHDRGDLGSTPSEKVFRRLEGHA